ncbi:MAG: ElyC/SanA/YdcF family protein [Bacteroidota bacterium]|nr:ElyC/SanA/YdcF family protein [Bacteroidota bacterium]
MKNLFTKIRSIFTRKRVMWGLIVLTFFVLFCNKHIETKTSPFLYNNINILPKVRVALVLGASNKRANGDDNMYFNNRIKAAYDLYYYGRIQKMILSGDNSKDYYNEPKVMRKALMDMGVPDSAIVLDYAGLRTFDSMIRAKEIFGLDSVMVVSQRFHNERAVFIARENGIIAYGYNASNVIYQNQMKVKVREFFAKVKCFLDVYVLATKPKHLGEKIKV